MFKFLWKLSGNLGAGIFLLLLLLKLPSSLPAFILIVAAVVFWLLLKPSQRREGCR